MELILENTERMVSGVLKFFAEAKFLIFQCHLHHLCKLLPPAHPSSKNRRLTTSQPTVPGGPGLHMLSPNIGKMADSTQGLLMLTSDLPR